MYHPITTSASGHIRAIPQLVYVSHHVILMFASVPVHFKTNFQLHLLKALQSTSKIFLRSTGTEAIMRNGGVGRTLIVELPKYCFILIHGIVGSSEVFQDKFVCN